MPKVVAEKKYSNFIIILLLAFPVLINSVKIFGNLILLLLAILGIYIAISERKNPFQIKELKLFSYLTVGYFGIILLSGLVADGLNYEFHHLGRKAQFLLAPFIALAILKVDFSLKKLLLSLKLGLIIIGIITMMQFQFHLGEEWLRPAGMMNQNIFGDIAVAMLFLSIVKVFDEKPKEQVITIAAAILGISAIILSGSRGSWISALILSLVWLSIIYNKYLHNNSRLKLAILGIFTAILLLVSNTQIVQDKISTTITGIQGWHTGDEQLSSSGERLNMWVSGLKAAKDSPWIGYGYRNANDATQKYTKQNVMYTHLHNEYITTLVSAGVVGLLALLALLFVPIIIFYQKLKDEKSYHYALMGVLLCVGYITFGFTHIAFGEEHVNAFYVLLMGFLLPRVIRS